jgi:hypothetical protein
MERVAAAAEIVAREPYEPWLVWSTLTAKLDALERLIPTALQVAGHPPM